MKVKFVPQNIEIDIKPNESVLQAAEANGIFIKSVCRGVPSCAECRVKVVEGDRNLMPPTAAEKSLIGSAYFVDGRRLACQLKCFGHVTIDLKDQIEKQQAQMGKRPKGRGARDDVGDSYAVRGSILAEREIEEAHRRERGEAALATGTDEASSSGDDASTVRRDGPGVSRETRSEAGGEQHRRSAGGSHERNDDRDRGGPRRQQESNRQGRPHGRDRGPRGDGHRRDQNAEGRRDDRAQNQGRSTDTSQKNDQKNDQRHDQRHDQRTRDKQSNQSFKGGGGSRGQGGPQQRHDQRRQQESKSENKSASSQSARPNEAKDPKKT